MYRNKKILALIPARGGSKGLPGKNIKSLLGKPLIAWTIEQAKGSKYSDKVIVSTDDSEIAKISKEYGAKVPFLRPKELATDDAKMIDVVMHAIKWLKGSGNLYDVVILLQPTSPIRKAEDIDLSVEYLFSKKASSVVSVCEADCPPNWINTLPENKCMKDFLSLDIINKNRQEFRHFYRLNGAIYLAFCDYLLKKKSFFAAETFAYIMPKERSVDIDDEIDFMFAEFLLERIVN
jgi:N-acylneuraminate cytidylyltransferase/CMP-N,N'-diacetyllegionaminic acid synthase